MNTPTEPAIDLDRFRHEARRAIDTGGTTMTELLEPGSLTAMPSGDGEVLLQSHGEVVGKVPLYRLGRVDLDLLTAKLIEGVDAIATEHPGTIDAAAFVAAINAGRFEVLEPRGTDLVWCFVIADEAGAPVPMFVHRCDVVPGWPTPEAEPS